MTAFITIILILAGARVFWWAINLIAKAEAARIHEDYNWWEEK